MVKIITECVKDGYDENIVNAMKQGIEFTNSETLNEEWESIKDCKFRHHLIGKGGNHIWVSRKEEDYRVMIIV